MPTVNIAQISDCHLFLNKDKCAYLDINPYQTLQQVLQRLKEETVELVIVTGDISGDSSLESYQHFEELWLTSEIDARLVVLPGNHDDVSFMQKVFSKSYLSNGYTLLGDHWQLHSLDSKFKGNLGYVDEKVLLGLEQEVKSSPLPFHLVAVHHHPVPCMSWMDKHEWVNRQDFVKTVSNSDKIKVVIYGHIHADTHHHFYDTDFWACPSTCWQWAQQDTFGVISSPPGYRLIALSGDGKVTTHVKWLETELIG